MPRTNPIPAEQIVIFKCACGSKRKASLHHYQLARCGNCGASYWALRPVAGGPLVAFPWPGTPEMKRFKEEQALEFSHE
jgi:hypothetical protein